MIKRLRIKLIAVLTLILSLVLCGILVAVNIFNYNVNMDESYRRLNMITSKAIGQQDRIYNFYGNNNEYYYDNSSSLADSEIYIAYVGLDGYIKSIYAENNTSYTYDQISAFTRQTLSHSAKQGKIGNLIYTVTEINYNGFGTAYAVGFMDNSRNIESFNIMIISSVIIFVAGTVIIFILSLMLSMWLIKPVEDAFNKQKQFISDASHELKTPIAVISANAELLEGDIGQNKWLGYIQSESDRMSKLVNSLLTLTRIETQADKALMTRFDICNAIMEVTMPFESVAFEKGVMLECDLENQIFINGNESQLKQVVAILTDNAVKHCTEGGTVSVSAEPFKSKCLIKVTNTGEPIPDGEKQKIFERFYRADQSRNRDNNRYGLGLAIAKQIVTNHHGTITANSTDGTTTFTVLV